MPNVALIVLRCIFVLVAASLGASLIKSNLLPPEPVWLLGGGDGRHAFARVAVIAIDLLIPRKRLQTITAVYFGVIVGMFLTYVVRLALDPLLSDTRSFSVQWVQLLLGMVLCYTCVSVLLQTKDDFRFIIPYVEFASEVKGRKPYVLDTSVVIDGRIADVVETQAFDNQLVMPRFAIQELQNIADSSDRMRRSRGRRGLDILNRLRSNTQVELMIFDRELPEFAGQPVDLKLVLLAKHLNGKRRHQRLQPQQGGQAARRRGDQPQRPGQRAQAGVPGRRDDRSPHRQAGRSAGPGHRLPGRRHDDRRRRGPRPHQPVDQGQRHQHAAKERRPHGLRPLRRPGRPASRRGGEVAAGGAPPFVVDAGRDRLWLGVRHFSDG